MLDFTHAIVARAALAVAGASALAAPVPLNPTPCVRAADAAPTADADFPAGLPDLEQLAALERSGADLEQLRGGDFTTAETVLITIGVVILIILIV